MPKKFIKIGVLQEEVEVLDIKYSYHIETIGHVNKVPMYEVTLAKTKSEQLHPDWNNPIIVLSKSDIKRKIYET